MGKAKKIKVSKGATKIPLEEQIADSQFVKPKGRVKTRGDRKENDDEVSLLNIFIIIIPITWFEISPCS